MTTIRITTDRLPQPHRRKGAILTVTPEKAASLVAQGFAVIVEEAAPQPPQQPPQQPPVEGDDAPSKVEAPKEAQQAPARRRRGAAL